MRNKFSTKNIIGAIVGALIVLIFLEIILRFVPMYLNVGPFEYVSNKNSKGITVVTLGESTTLLAGNKLNNLLVQSTSYPAFLQKKFNEEFKTEKVNIINLGIMSGNTSRSLEELEKFYLKNKVDYVVVMSGMKDERDTGTKDYAYLFKNKLEKIKIIKFAFLFYDEIVLRINGLGDKKVIKNFSDLNSDWMPIVKQDVYLNMSKQLNDVGFNYNEIVSRIEEIYLANYYYNTGNLIEAQKIYLNLIKEIDYGYFPLLSIYNRAEDFESSERLILSYINKQPEKNTFAFKELIMLYARQKDNKKINDVIQKYKLKNNYDINISTALGNLYLLNEQYKEAETKYDEFCNVKNVKLIEVSIPRKSISHYLNEIRNRDVLYECFFNNAYSSWMNKRFDKSESILTQYLKYNSNDVAAIALLKKIKMETNKKNLLEPSPEGLTRLGDFYLLMQDYNARGDLIKEKYLEDLMFKNFKGTMKNFESIVKLAQKNKSKIIFLQYPNIKLSYLLKLTENLKGITYVDNENLFINGPRNEYVFEARYPYHFSHFTQKGSELVSNQVFEILEKMIKNKKHEN